MKERMKRCFEKNSVLLFFVAEEYNPRKKTTFSSLVCFLSSPQITQIIKRKRTKTPKERERERERSRCVEKDGHGNGKLHSWRSRAAFSSEKNTKQ